MSDLSVGVDAGIGSTGPQKGDSLIIDFGNRGFKGALDRSVVGLALPSREIRSIIGDMNPQTEMVGCTLTVGSTVGGGQSRCRF